MATVYSKSSPYYNTPQRNSLVNFLDLMNHREIPEDATDELLTIDVKFNKRPDLLSYDLYGTPNLWWIFTVRNPDQLIDPIYDLVTDLDIYVPSKKRLFGILGL